MLEETKYIDVPISILDIELLENPNFINELSTGEVLEYLKKSCPQWFLRKVSEIYINKNYFYNEGDVLQALLSHDSLPADIVKELRFSENLK